MLLWDQQDEDANSILLSVPNEDTIDEFLLVAVSFYRDSLFLVALGGTAGQPDEECNKNVIGKKNQQSSGSHNKEGNYSRLHFIRHVLLSWIIRAMQISVPH